MAQHGGAQCAAAWHSAAKCVLRCAAERGTAQQSAAQRSAPVALRLVVGVDQVLQVAKEEGAVEAVACGAATFTQCMEVRNEGQEGDLRRQQARLP